ncbi:SHOCT domain-containing protein [Vibrio sp. F74]|uniref:SHOCT domain-containing protein n=1 Tax=Vibrio sp. F74 TaxID=700020 RepID=UPI0035F5749D
MVYLILIIVLIFLGFAMTKNVQNKTDETKKKATKEKVVEEKLSMVHKAKASEFIQMYIKNEDEYQQNPALKRVFVNICTDPNIEETCNIESAIQLMVAPPDNKLENMEKLKKLAELKELGVLTDEEFNTKKAELLALI